MTREEMLQDLAYARNLAEEGRHAPLIGGSYFVMFGVLLALCYGAQWAILSGGLDVARSALGYVWLGFGASAALGGFLLSRRVRALPGGTSIPNRVDRNVWQAVVIALSFVVAGAILRGMTNGDYAVTNAIVAVGFGLYGVALYATATIGGHGWLRTFAWLSWVVSGALWFFLGEAWLYLLAAGASVAVLIVPGVVMLRREPTMVV